MKIKNKNKINLIIMMSTNDMVPKEKRWVFMRELKTEKRLV